MSTNNRLDRRHDVNAGERLPERLSRVLDVEEYALSIERVLENEKDEFRQQLVQAAKEWAAMRLAEKKANIKAGDVVFLLWTGVQVVKVDAVSEDNVDIRGVRYGWEMVQKPSAAFLEALKVELGEVEL